MIFICRKVKIQMPARARIVYFICNFPKDKFFLRKFNVKHKILQQNLKTNPTNGFWGDLKFIFSELVRHKKTGIL